MSIESTFQALKDWLSSLTFVELVFVVGYVGAILFLLYAVISPKFTRRNQGLNNEMKKRFGESFQ
jgi:hypothetical protein